MTPEFILTITDRVQKLKDARTEAAKEIEQYKAQKESEFKKFESDVSVVGCLLFHALCSRSRPMS